MGDIPQPSPDPYAPGDTVRVYLSPDDRDSSLHDVTVEIIDVFTDSFDKETGREMDRYSYRVCRVDNQEVVGVQFRHRDLVPANAE